jgi:uncharacterized protein YjbJ (UPF0337 family)
MLECDRPEVVIVARRPEPAARLGGSQSARRRRVDGRGSPFPQRRNDVSATDKIKNAAQNMVGKVKEALGKTSGDKKMQAEGKTDQAASDLKQAGEDVKDTFKDGT